MKKMNDIEPPVIFLYDILYKIKWSIEWGKGQTQLVNVLKSCLIMILIL